MGLITAHNKVNLVVGLISSRPRLFDEVLKAFSRKFDRPDFISGRINFNFTDYYKAEFGKGLLRVFSSFERLIVPEELADIKVYSNRLEQRFSRRGKRLINIDPGYIDSGKLVLATTKDHQHRIYIKDGIYEEVTLRFKGRSFRPWPWTYPDYRSDRYIKIFNEIRRIYRQKL